MTNTKQAQLTETKRPSTRTKFYKIMDGIYNEYPTDTVKTYKTAGLTIYTRLQLASYKVNSNGTKVYGWIIEALHDGDIEIAINQSLDGKNVVIQKWSRERMQPLLLSLPIKDIKVRRGLSSKPSYYLEGETLATIKEFIEADNLL